jgi:MFS family permease
MVVVASTLGTLFEWYDFFLYGALATSIAAHFFSAVNPTTGFIFALAGFAVGFLVRPLGALVFGRVGDTVGRKTTFLVTLTIMGLATVGIGLIPGYSTIGIAAPLGLVGLRILQGLAIGGEFAGAITYVSEHAPDDRRGLQTSLLTASSLCGLVLSLLVIASTRAAIGAEAFEDWGWRIPFVGSAVLLAISLWIRLRLHESPVFRQLKADNGLSKAPLAEAFLRWANLKLALIALAATAGQAVIYYTTTFYALYFIQRAAKVEPLDASLLLGVALVAGVALFASVGWLSDRVGRRPLLLCGYGLAALLLFPLFRGLLSAANPALARAHVVAPIVVVATRGSCSLQFDPLGRNRFRGSSCDIASSFLAGAGVSYSVRRSDAADPARLLIGERSIEAPDPAAMSASDLTGAITRFESKAQSLLASAGHGIAADPGAINRPLTIAILIALLAVSALCSAPINIMLAELFPGRIRYSALALPQNVGNGWFGGLLPATAFTIVAATGSIFAGLWYPVAIAAGSFVICGLFLPETKGRSLR